MFLSLCYIFLGLAFVVWYEFVLLFAHVGCFKFCYHYENILNQLYGCAQILPSLQKLP